jgi:hypothetical protein
LRRVTGASGADGPPSSVKFQLSRVLRIPVVEKKWGSMLEYMY